MKGKHLLLLSVICFPLLLKSQTATKGMQAEQSQTEIATGRTYALIVGISKYKNPDIPQLQFADKDAIAFRNYLTATGTDSGNITLLLNEEARYSEILLDLDDICTNKAKAGDKVFFYFSGHGDVESHVITNDGYLLPYDAPKVVYAISAINVRILQEYVSTLSSKGVQVIVMTDACHSGNLAGGIEGLKNIQNVLKENWKDEVKILSCQPGELSLEGKQWGNGRGLFSYELINGMAGMADKNKDGKVSLLELNLYLMEKVPEGANPALQTPIISGNMASIVSLVNKTYLEKIKSNNAAQTLAMVDAKGFDEKILKNLNDTVKANYQLFKTYLDSGIYVRRNEKENLMMPSAYYYCSRIPVNEDTKILIGLMKRNLAAAMIDQINAAVLTYVSNRYADYGKNSALAEFDILKSIMGKDKLIKLGIYSKIIFEEEDDNLYNGTISNTLSRIDSGLAYDNTASYLYYLKGRYYQELNDTLSIPNYKKALEISPSFLSAESYLGYVYANNNKEYLAIKHFKNAFNQGGDFIGWPLEGLVMEYYKIHKPDSANYYLTKMIQLPLIDSIHKVAAMNRFREIADASFAIKNYQVAIDYYKKAAYIDPNFDYAYLRLGQSYLKTMQYDSAIAYYHKANVINNIGQDLSISFSFEKLGIKDSADFYFQKAFHENTGQHTFDSIMRADSALAISIWYCELENYEKSIEFALKAINKKEASYNIACCYSLMNQPANSLKYLERSFMQGYHNLKHIQGDTDLDNIRDEPEFKKLIAKYFPD